MRTQRKAHLALADGTVFTGLAFGAEAETVGEVVFNTSLTGYQETLTDPSYVGQIVTFTVPELGNVGVNHVDQESEKPHAIGVIARHVARIPSNYRATGSLPDWMERHGLPGIEGIDTRKLVRHLRDHGAQAGVLSTLADAEPAALVEKARAAADMSGLDLVTGITTRAAYEFNRPMGEPLDGEAVAPAARFHVVAYDYGLKAAMLQLLVDRGCRITVVPAHTPAEEVLGLRPNGVFLTNGPGDPAAVTYAAPIVRGLLGKVPLFGICLGHQILALAIGARTFKLRFGHRGANHPVLDRRTGKVAITSQNHGFAVDAASLEGTGAEVTHVSLNDGTVEGIAIPHLSAFSVQHHPEASPGPHDARELFDRFLREMEARRA
ncbi:glutamine-hydrolyzing carbamoyl-phosphate synthase small subunit [Vulgatibacter incomptus]|uniref:Carbamoyl phosphate synthase small chain n=1 Tax=Vulgatibacter incomptus TaxID=1391653 RepID=A0A0K1PDH8_9BACT|nr:glutamine-hydrolyzing carbamoyl-phosphate synthase small subunit [Vulgatibacter incomptus]AKU91461.1 Carbamoyl-phosphate synthase small chain [Vulgatibacter incomptus]